jgi:predicted NAD/FAD-binding protein
VEAVLVAAFCVALSAAQRALSTPVRTLRRSVTSVSGELTMLDGTTRPLDAAVLREPAEGALRLLSVAVPLLAAGLLVARFA